MHTVGFFTDNNTSPAKGALSWFGLLVGLWQYHKVAPSITNQFWRYTGWFIHLTPSCYYCVFLILHRLTYLPIYLPTESNALSTWTSALCGWLFQAGPFSASKCISLMMNFIYFGFHKIVIICSKFVWHPHEWNIHNK